jgi:hypothetical protein
MSNKKLFYFGCIGACGHYLFPALRDADKEQMPGVNFKVIQYIDGLYTPSEYGQQGAAQFTQVGPLSIISWHDFTIDKRPGSNSNIIGYGYTGDQKQIIEDMFNDFKIKFPQVYKRQTTPITLKQ